MFFWSRFPFIRITIFFILGILLGIFIPELEPLILTGLLLSMLSMIVLIWKRKKWLNKVNLPYGINLSIIFLLLGFVVENLAEQSNRPDHIIHTEGINYYSVRVVSEPHEKGDFIRIKLKILSVKDSLWKKSSGKVLAYLRLPLERMPVYGDRLLIKGSPQRVNLPMNPYEFDYRKYLAYNQVHHQHFVNPDDWVFQNSPSVLSVKQASIKVRDVLERKLEMFIPGTEELAIAKALILGDKGDLDDSTKKVYALSGAMHILAVSGLHVGVIYMVLLWLLGQRNGKVTRPVLVAFIVIPTLWAYAFITGLSPSVLRAVTMFSFLALAQVTNRKSNSLNTLAISAFLLLLINPFMIMSVGFQLSYVAVGGIIFLYPRVEEWYYPTNAVVRFFWQITALSIAAQIATAPLSAYYFHRFPTYFLVSNPVVIPAAILIVWGGLFLLGLGSISTAVGLILGKMISFIILIMNSVLNLISNLPYADIHDLMPSMLDTWYLYGLIVFTFLYLIMRKKYYYWLSFGLIVLLGINYTIRQQNDASLKQIVFYSLSNEIVIDFVEEKTFIPATPSDEFANSNKLEYSVQPYRLAHSLEPSTTPANKQKIDELGEVMVWHGIKILLADPCLRVEDLPVYFDFIIFKTDRTVQKCYQDQIVMRKLVADSNADYAIHYLRKEGALIIDI